MKAIYELFEAYFAADTSPPAELKSFFPIDKDCLRIEHRPVHFVDTADGKRGWTEFWKLFLCNLKLLMLFHELKEERQLVAMFPVRQLD